MSRALRSSVWSSPDSLDAVPSTPRPTGTPAASMSGTRAIPAASRALDDGQCATPVPVRAKAAMSESFMWTQCAIHTSSPSQPVDSK